MQLCHCLIESKLQMFSVGKKSNPDQSLGNIGIFKYFWYKDLSVTYSYFVEEDGFVYSNICLHHICIIFLNTNMFFYEDHHYNDDLCIGKALLAPYLVQSLVLVVQAQLDQFPPNVQYQYSISIFNTRYSIFNTKYSTLNRLYWSSRPSCRTTSNEWCSTQNMQHSIQNIKHIQCKTFNSQSPVLNHVHVLSV